MVHWITTLPLCLLVVAILPVTSHIFLNNSNQTEKAFNASVTENGCVANSVCSILSQFRNATELTHGKICSCGGNRREVLTASSEREDCSCDFNYFSGPPIEGSVWPLPQKIQYGHANRTVQFNNVFFSFRGLANLSCDIIKFAVDTYTKKWIFPIRQASRNDGQLTIVVHMHEKCPSKNEFPQQKMNESYYLRIPESGDATLEAVEVWGILRGFETLSQLTFRANSSFMVRTAIIRDWPEYPVRGILIDTARHYLSKNVILRQIDLMAQNKMNVLHWHIVDVESFPYVSRAFANLSFGAYSRLHVYSRNTVSEVINYGRLRGVRVMIEFDTPGHMSSWFGQADLLAECRDSQGKLMPPAIIDPSNENNFEFLKKFFTEILQTFPERLVHLGGDETSYWINECWGNNTKIQRFIKEQGLNNTAGLFQYYNRRLSEIVNELLETRDDLHPTNSNGRIVFWDEIFETKPDKNSIIHLWRPGNKEERQNRTAQITAAGYSVILSSCWYLNLIKYGSDWLGPDDNHNYYSCDPRHFNGTKEQKMLVLGGVATMWGEYADGTNIEARLWPRASTVAERLWSSPKATRAAVEAWPRLHEHRCRMIARGYRAEPIYGADWCPSEFDENLP